MSDKIPILMNTHAGAMHAEAGQEQLERMALDVGLDMCIIRTQSVDDLKRELQRLVADEVPKVAIAGGDGTVALAIQELAHTNTALGILSQGTFNNFASTVRLHHNLPAALETLKSGSVKAVDLGKIGDRYFTESAGIGLFADALAIYGTSNKNPFRTVYAMAYLLATYGPQSVALTIDGNEQIEQFTVCEVCNTYRIAQAIPLAPEADIDDGLLDVVIFSDVQRHEWPSYLRALRAQMHLGLPKVKVLRGKEIRISPAKPRNVHADDHNVGQTPRTITVQPGALKVLVDASI